MNGKKAKRLRREAREQLDPNIGWELRGKQRVRHQYKGVVERAARHPDSGKAIYRRLKHVQTCK